MKILEGKFHEEKLKLQQKHDTDVQKVRTIFFQRQYIRQNNRESDYNKFFTIVLIQNCN